VSPHGPGNEGDASRVRKISEAIDGGDEGDAASVGDEGTRAAAPGDAGDPASPTEAAAIADRGSGKGDVAEGALPTAASAMPSSAPQKWHCVAFRSFTASQRSHGLSRNVLPHSLQNLAPAGLA
jgi:hypothetical protein